MNVPKLRFKELDGEWEESNLGEVVKVLDGDRGKNYPSGNDFSTQGHTLFLSAANVTKKGFSFDERQYITQNKSDSLGNGKLEEDDIVLTSRGSLGHVAWYNSNVKKKIPFARINSGMLILRSNKNISPRYISQFLVSPIGKRQIDVISFGSAQPQLTKKDIQKYKLFMPKFVEQQKVGFFFQQIDKKIQLQQEKVDLLKEQKKGFMQKIFSQELRFSKHTEQWSSFKVSDVATLINGRAYKKEELLSKGKYRVLRVGNFFTNDSWYYSNLELDDNKYAEKEDLLYAWSASFGPKIWHEEKVIYHYHIWKVVPNVEMVCRDFLYHWFIFDKTRIIADKNGSTLVHITKGGLEETTIEVPYLDEQKVIVDFLNNIDKKISLNEDTLTTLESQKLAFMQQMFI